MTRHLLFNTYRSQRGWLWMFWFLCVVQIVLGLMNPTHVPSQVMRMFLFAAQCFLGAFAIVGGIQMYPVASTAAFWLTRPISPRQVLTTQLVFVYGLVFAPLIVGLTPGWLTAGFTGLQLLGTSGEWILYVGAVITLGAAGAAHTKNVPTFFALGGGTVGGAIFLGAGLEYLSRTARVFGPPPRWSDSSHASSLLVGLTVIVIASLFSWRMRMLTHQPVRSYAVVVVAVLLMMLNMILRPFNFMKADLSQPEGTELALVRETNIQPATAPGEQLLWSHFRVSGLPTNMVAIPNQMHYGFNNGEKLRLRGSHHEQGHFKSSIDRLQDFSSRQNFNRHMRGFYPADTVWSGRWHGSQYYGIPLATKVKQWPKNRTGELSGYVEADFFEIERVVDLPLRDSYVRAGAGRAFAVQLLGDDDRGTRFDISDVRPNITFSVNREPRRSGARSGNSLFVLYHPKSREVFLLESSSYRNVSPTLLNNQMVTTRTFHVPRSALRERLTGHVSGNWLNELRLHIYQAKPVGRSRLDFNETDYEFALTRVKRPNDYVIASQTGVDHLKSMKWPGVADPEAAQEFAREFMAHQPHNYYRTQSRDVGKLLTDIGPEVVPFLLREAPFAGNTRRVVMRSVLRKLIRPEHRAEVIAAVGRDPELAGLVRRKGWEKDGATELAKLLPGRRKVLPGEALRVLSARATPDQYADLKWHAERCDRMLEYVYENLRKLEGFPYEETVRAAWKRARLQLVPDAELSPFAAEFGELDALHRFVRLMHTSKVEAREKRAFGILKDNLGITGTEAELKKWLVANAAKLRFDPDTKKYVL